MTRERAKDLLKVTKFTRKHLEWFIDIIYDQFEKSNNAISVTLPEPAMTIQSSPMGAISPDLINLKRNKKYDIYIIESKDQ